MQHGVQFTIGNVTKHSMSDWGLLFSPFPIPSAEPKYNYIDIDGADSSIDATEAFGGVNYNDVDFTLTFTVPKCNFNQKLREIKAFLHGRETKITIYNDANFYYLGRCKVNEFKSNGAIGELVIDVKAKPYKYKQQPTVVNVTVSGSKTATFNNESMRTVPSFKCSASMTLQHNGNTYTVGTAQTKVADIVFEYGTNTITFTGNGTVTVTYQEGAL